MSSILDDRDFDATLETHSLENIRSDYGKNGILIGVFLVLLVGLVILMMLLVKFFSNLFRVERAPLQHLPRSSHQPNPVKLMWNTLWDQPMPPSRSMHNMHFSASTRHVTDSEHGSLYYPGDTGVKA